MQRLVEEPIDDETSDQEMEDAELEAEALGAERPGTGTTVGDRQASLAQGGDAQSDTMLAVDDAGDDSNA